MIPKVKELKCISIYLDICNIHDSHLRLACVGFSNIDHGSPKSMQFYK